MKSKVLLLFALSFLLFSCDHTFVISGKIINKHNLQPIENARVISSEHRITYTDNEGYFRIDCFGPGSQSDKLKLLIEKPGYKTEYIDLSNYHNDLYKIQINLTSTNQIQLTVYDKSWVKRLYIFNLIFTNLTTSFTLLFIAIKKIKFKWLWLFAICVVNVVLNVNYFNGSCDIDFINSPFFLKHYGFYPFTLKIVLPIPIIVFWVLYFSKKYLFVKSKEDN